MSGGALVAHYWTGGAPSPRRISNVSNDGAYIEAPDKWYPGTVITLIFQLDSVASDGPSADPSLAGNLPTCTIRAVVVRTAPGGFGVEFLFGDQDERSDFHQFLQSALGMDQTPVARTHTAGSG